MYSTGQVAFIVAVALLLRSPPQLVQVQEVLDELL
jgi:hypothetical protein